MKNFTKDELLAAYNKPDATEEAKANIQNELGRRALEGAGGNDFAEKSSTDNIREGLAALKKGAE